MAELGIYIGLPLLYGVLLWLIPFVVQYYKPRYFVPWSFRYDFWLTVGTLHMMMCFLALTIWVVWSVGILLS